jgi:hypothetical protein
MVNDFSVLPMSDKLIQREQSTLKYLNVLY